MLSKQYRLPGSKIPSLIFSTHSVITPLFILKYKRSSSNHPRLGFIVSKKNISLAVNRNRLKRLFRHALKPLLPHIKNHDCLFIIKKQAAEQSLNQISLVVAEALQQAQIIYEKPSSQHH